MNGGKGNIRARGFLEKADAKKEERIVYSYYKYTDTGFEKTENIKNHEGDLVIFLRISFLSSFQQGFALVNPRWLG